VHRQALVESRRLRSSLLPGRVWPDIGSKRQPSLRSQPTRLRAGEVAECSGRLCGTRRAPGPKPRGSSSLVPADWVSRPPIGSVQLGNSSPGTDTTTRSVPAMSTTCGIASGIVRSYAAGVSQCCSVRKTQAPEGQSETPQGAPRTGAGAYAFVCAGSIHSTLGVMRSDWSSAIGAQAPLPTASRDAPARASAYHSRGSFFGLHW